MTEKRGNPDATARKDFGTIQLPFSARAEAQELEERKREALKQEKERKRQHYLSQVKNSKPPKAMRIYEESAPVPTKVVEQKPRTLIGKFLRWLNT